MNKKREYRYLPVFTSFYVKLYSNYTDLGKSVANGKNLIGGVVGGNSSSTFQVLANNAQSIKTSRDSYASQVSSLNTQLTNMTNDRNNWKNIANSRLVTSRGSIDVTFESGKTFMLPFNLKTVNADILAIRIKRYKNHSGTWIDKVYAPMVVSCITYTNYVYVKEASSPSTVFYVSINSPINNASTTNIYDYGYTSSSNTIISVSVSGSFTGSSYSSRVEGYLYTDRIVTDYKYIGNDIYGATLEFIAIKL